MEIREFQSRGRSLLVGQSLNWPRQPQLEIFSLGRHESGRTFSFPLRAEFSNRRPILSRGTCPMILGHEEI